MERSYLIRYGLMGQVGRFAADPCLDLKRGCSVVIRSYRGTELGEVLVESADSTTPGLEFSGPARVLRVASADDLMRSQARGSERDQRFDDCQRVFQDGVWPIDLIDVEPLLDEGRIVLHYLGPHRLDTEGVLAAFRTATNLDIMLQPVGRDIEDDPLQEASHGCGSCSGGGCSSSGGCGTSGSCGDCGVKNLLASGR